ncbi:hypothetical protein EVAR_44183_1 [Eumeta japonica]|uniref:Uncharacterized protein n=1 Tax=Eumeta variegata TaxID=151549 RepID=A0A4C1W3J8_EUMVA|nr:hypothetical protein EVAR_44183_1 [Eumeta japonica]
MLSTPRPHVASAPALSAVRNTTEQHEASAGIAQQAGGGGGGGGGGRCGLTAYDTVAVADQLYSPATPRRPAAVVLVRMRRCGARAGRPPPAPGAAASRPARPCTGLSRVLSIYYLAV